MKANLKGQSGVKGLLLLHGEKLLIGVVALAAAYLLYSALGVERLPADYQADNLQSKVQQVLSRIGDPNNTFQRAAEQEGGLVKVHTPLDKVQSLAVDSTAYAFNGSFNRPVIAPSAPRTDPILIAATSVRAYSGADLMGFQDDEAAARYALRQQQQQETRGGEGRRGEEPATTRGRRPPRGDQRGFEEENIDPNRRPVGETVPDLGVSLDGSELIELNRWVSVVAKAPVLAQRTAYRDAFEQARGGYDPVLDFPQYIGYSVERAEVLPDGALAPWQPVQVYDAKGTPNRRLVGALMGSNITRELEKLAATVWAPYPVEELVDPRYLDTQRNMIYPLPPVVGREWGKEVTHPEIPLEADAPLQDRFAGAVDPTGAGTLPGQENVGPLDLQADQNASFTRPEGRIQGRYRGRERFDDGGRGRGSTVYEGRGTGQASPLAAGVDHWLVRFFDFAAMPGKMYSYRVQLVLFDPNQRDGVTYDSLAPAVVERLRALPKVDNRIAPAANYVRAPWSEPSPPIGVPLDGRVYAAEFKPAAGTLLSDDPRVKLLVESFRQDPETKNYQAAAVEKDFSRGAVANFQDDAWVLVDDNRYLQRVPSLNYVTGVTVVDMRGGERLPVRDLTAPSRVLVMGPAGDLSIRRELEDVDKVQLHRAITARPKPQEGDREQRGGRGGRTR
jgi:hypothetical protein